MGTLFKYCLVFPILCATANCCAQTIEVLLYFSNETGSFQLYEYKQGNDTLLIDDAAYNYWWVFTSPTNEKFLTYRSDTATGNEQNDYANAELLLYDINGTNPTLLIDTNTYNWDAHGVAKFSPDGSRILMCAIPNGTNVFRGFVTDSMGQGAQQISNWYMLDAAWSPDGSSIVFCGFPNNNITIDLTQLEIFTAPFDNGTNTIGTPTQITSGTGRVHDPCYSNNGDRIAFSDGNLFYSVADIAVVDTSGANYNVVFSGGGANGGSIFWSENDEYIWFHNVTLFVNPFEIRKVDVNTGIPTTVEQDPGHSYISPHMYYDNAVYTFNIPTENPDLLFYPSPANNLLHIYSEEPDHLTLTTLFGRIVSVFPIGSGNSTLNISHLPPGFYLVRSERGSLGKLIIR